MTFADYAPYLEISVAINLLFGIWHVLWHHFIDRVDTVAQNRFDQSKEQAANLAMNSNLVLPQLLTEADWNFMRSLCDRIHYLAISFAIVVVTLIMLALFFVKPDLIPSRCALVLIFFTPLSQPILMVILVLIVYTVFVIQVRLKQNRLRRNAIREIEQSPIPKDDQ